MANCDAQQSEMGVYSKGASVQVHSTVRCIAGCDASTQQIANASEFSNVWQIVMHSEVRWESIAKARVCKYIRGGYG